MDEERRWDGSNAQWLLKQNVYDTLCKASDRIIEHETGCILDYIFGEETSPDNCLCFTLHAEDKNDAETMKESCRKCIEDFLYKRHR